MTPLSHSVSSVAANGVERHECPKRFSTGAGLLNAATARQPRSVTRWHPGSFVCWEANVTALPPAGPGAQEERVGRQGAMICWDAAMELAFEALSMPS